MPPGDESVPGDESGPAISERIGSPEEHACRHLSPVHCAGRISGTLLRLAQALETVARERKAKALKRQEIARNESRQHAAFFARALLQTLLQLWSGHGRDAVPQDLNPPVYSGGGSPNA